MNKLVVELIFKNQALIVVENLKKIGAIEFKIPEKDIIELVEKECELK